MKEASFRLKLKALMEALEFQNIDKFINEAKLGDYTKLGIAYTRAVKEKN
jgi:hypothetical protein